MSIIGVDASTRNVTVCWGGGEDALLRFEMRSVPSWRRGQRVVQRMACYERLSDEIVATVNAARPKLIVLKGYGSPQDRDVAELPEFGGILRWRLVQLARVVEVEPATLNRFVLGRATGSKRPLAAQLTRRLGVVLETDEELDAYCLWRLGLALAQRRRTDRETLESVQLSEAWVPRLAGAEDFHTETLP